MSRSQFAVCAAALIALAACGPTPAQDRNDQSRAPRADMTGRSGENTQVGRWNREAAAADRLAIDDASGLLRSARDAMADPRGGDRAMEMLERAESRLLTRDTPRGAEQQPMNSGAQARIASARRSLGRNNRQEAMQEIVSALQDLQDELAANSRR